MPPRVTALICSALAYLLCGAVQAAPKLAVLELELTGDLGGPEFEQEHAQRLKSQTAELRTALSASGRFELLDNKPAEAVIARLQSQHAHIFDCACDVEVGKALGADLVLIAWVDRVSGLILSLSYEFHDVATNQIVARQSYDFRGDNDAAWKHAIDYAVRHLPDNIGAH